MAGRKRNLPNQVRRDVCRRYGAAPGSTVSVKCHYCDHVGAIEWHVEYRYWPIVNRLEFDHYIPEHVGGLSAADNIVLACRPCNRSKGHTAPTAPLAMEVADAAH